MAQTDYKFEGWMGLDPNAAQGNMVWQEFEPKEWEETDVDVKISHCGICGSDLHTLRSGWVRVAIVYYCGRLYRYVLTYLAARSIPLLCRARDCGHRRARGIQGDKRYQGW